MQRSTPSIRTLLGALMLSAGIASPIALADDGVSEEQHTGESAPPVESVVDPGDSDSSSTREDADLVRVRVSLPDGRTITRLEPKHSMSARYGNRSSTPQSTSRRLADGSRISIGSRSVSGGSNSGSAQSSGGGGGGGSSSSASGGGGGASSSGGGGSVASKSEAGEQRGAGVFSFGAGESATASGSEASNRASGSSATPRPIPTIGNPTYDRDGNASGGQRVEFHDAGMSAAVIGNRVYFTGAEMVSANAPFEVITGTRFATDSVIMDSLRLDSSGSDLLSSFNTRNSEIKVQMESGTVVDFVLFTPSDDPNNPERVQRTWTVRIR